MTDPGPFAEATITIPFTLLLSQAAVDRLTLLRDASADGGGAALNLTQWMTLKLREMAIGAEWSAAVQGLQRQLEIDATAAIRAERERLLAAV